MAKDYIEFRGAQICN